MTIAKELLKQRYYEPIKEQPELFVGIELEYPVVNLSANATDVSLTKQLLVYLLDNFDFQADKYDSDNNPIQLIDKASGDMILLKFRTIRSSLLLQRLREFLRLRNVWILTSV